MTSTSTDPITGETIHDSPTSWVKRHIDEYVATDGEKGMDWRGAPTLLLTTRGRKSGKLRRSALIYGKHEGRFIVVGSRGGAPAHPSWYLNLEENPDVRIQVGGEVHEGTARTAEGDERAQLWELMAGIWPDYLNYEKKTDREIPVVVIEVP